MNKSKLVSKKENRAVFYMTQDVIDRLDRVILAQNFRGKTIHSARTNYVVNELIIPHILNVEEGLKNAKVYG